MLNLEQEQIRVRLPLFEGPLDLLLYLIKKDEVDIYDISIERITRQYLEYLEVMKIVNLEIAGEFMVMAATLIYMKSRTLLPTEVRPPEDDAEEDDPRWDLIRQLIEYRKFKEAAFDLHLREVEREGVFERRVRPLEFDPEPWDGENLGVFDLISAFQKVLKRAESRSEDLREIFEDRWTVSDKIVFLKEYFLRRLSAAFSELFPVNASRTEVVVTFLALLEMMRLRHLGVRQKNAFEEIEIYRRQEEAVSHDA
jgi:segregation and condensation protein A